MLTYRHMRSALRNRRGTVAARIIIWTLAGLALLAAVGIAPRWWHERQLRASVDAVGKTLPVVTVALPTRAADTTDLIMTGNIQAVQEAALYARVDGYLKRRLVTIGDRVQSGQVLAEIDTPELDQQLSQAQATLAQARSNLQQSRAALQHNETQLEYSRTNLDRWRVMIDRSLVSQQDFDDRQVLVRGGKRMSMRRAPTSPQRSRTFRRTKLTSSGCCNCRHSTRCGRRLLASLRCAMLTTARSSVRQRRQQSAPFPHRAN